MGWGVGGMCETVSALHSLILGHSSSLELKTVWIEYMGEEMQLPVCAEK